MVLPGQGSDKLTGSTIPDGAGNRPEVIMKVEVLADAENVAARAASVIAESARAAFKARHRFVMAVSGGRTPWTMLRLLAKEDVPWEAVHVLQVDERIAPACDSDRNFSHLRDSLLENAPLEATHIHAMPVELSNMEAAAAAYAKTLEAIAGSHPVLDVVHLGLGSDGHTASLIPGDSVLQVSNEDVALTGTYQGRRRMTLTYPLINRARQILWVVTGGEKQIALGRLLNGDASIPGGLIRRQNALVLADKAAAGANRKETTCA